MKEPCLSLMKQDQGLGTKKKMMVIVYVIIDRGKRKKTMR